MQKQNIIAKFQRKFTDIFSFFLPRKNSRQDLSKFSRDMILWKTWRSLLLSLSLSLNKPSILSKIKEAYLSWVAILPHIAKSSRYTLGTRIENKFLDLLEFSYSAYFASKENKSAKIAGCIFVSDIIKYLLPVAWEGKTKNSTS